MIQTALSQQPGCVVDPSYVMYASVFGINERNEMCLIGVEEPEINKLVGNVIFTVKQFFGAKLLLNYLNANYI